MYFLKEIQRNPQICATLHHLGVTECTFHPWWSLIKCARNSFVSQILWNHFHLCISRHSHLTSDYRGIIFLPFSLVYLQHHISVSNKPFQCDGISCWAAPGGGAVSAPDAVAKRGPGFCLQVCSPIHAACRRATAGSRAASSRQENPPSQTRKLGESPRPASPSRGVGGVRRAPRHTRHRLDL